MRSQASLYVKWFSSYDFPKIQPFSLKIIRFRKMAQYEKNKRNSFFRALWPITYHIPKSKFGPSRGQGGQILAPLIIISLSSVPAEVQITLISAENVLHMYQT